jgi:pyruvate ferredoxin oxidoreductase gamma subunit
MLEVRFHGRGGQGAVTSAELVAQAAIAEGRFAQAFPSFGPERRGAPVIAYLRVSDKQIRDRTAIRTPNVVIVLDPSLPGIVKVDAGLEEGGWVVVNSAHSPARIREEFGITANLAVVNANQIAREEIGRVITNTTMLGAFIRATGTVGIEALSEALQNRFGRIAARNINAFKRAHSEAAIEEVTS